MQINLSDILGLPDGTRQYTAVYEPDEVSFQGSAYKILGKEPVQLTIHHGEGQELSITADVDMVLQAACDRCLRPVSVPLRFNSKFEVDMAQTEDERIQDLNETAFIEGHMLDVDRLVEGELYVHLPMKVLCSDDCPGLSEDADTFSDSEPDACADAGSDPRMAVIRDLFKNANSEDSKEV